MILSLWLGLYVVTRNPRNLISWLTGLMLWTITRLFFDVLLALIPPPMPTSETVWLQFFFPFWRAVILKSQGQTGWLQGWSLISAIMFWHHVTTLMRPGPLTPWRWARILFGYGVALAWIGLNITTPYFFASTIGNPLYLNTLKAGPVYPLFAVLMLLYTGISVTNLIRSARAMPIAMPRQQQLALTIATIIGGLASPLTVAASAFGVPIPILFLAWILGLYVISIGYGVARYSALVSGRTIRYDFFYNVILVGGVTLIYVFASWIAIQAYNLPPIALVLLVLLAIGSHTLLDVGRYGLDLLFYQRDIRRLRMSLRHLATIVGEQTIPTLPLAPVLESLCESVQATYGVLVIFADDALKVAATYNLPLHYLNLAAIDLRADDVLILNADTLPAPLTEAALLIPLYTDSAQLGALILGHPKNGTHYAQADIDLLLYPSDWLADMLQKAQREAELLTQIADLAEQPQPPVEVAPQPISVQMVENALRNLAHYAYLGEHPLAKLELVQTRLPAEAITHLDRGKAVYSVLADAVAKLQPDTLPPPSPPTRAWYGYLILYQAYFEDIPNREIMARLYISEGTFNRTRRAALRALSKLLTEMEAAH